MPFPIAFGEWLSTRREFVELIMRGGIGTLQPVVGRVGGIGEARPVRRMAAERNPAVVPRCWKAEISLSSMLIYLPIKTACGASLS